MLMEEEEWKVLRHFSQEIAPKKQKKLQQQQRQERMRSLVSVEKTPSTSFSAVKSTSKSSNDSGDARNLPLVTPAKSLESFDLRSLKTPGQISSMTSNNSRGMMRTPASAKVKAFKVPTMTNVVTEEKQPQQPSYTTTEENNHQSVLEKQNEDKPQTQMHEQEQEEEEDLLFEKPSSERTREATLLKHAIRYSLCRFFFLLYIHS